MCAHLRLDVVYQAASHPALHPGQSAQIRCGERVVGWLGALHPGTSQALDLNAEVYLFELDLSHTSNQSPARYQRISKYPQIRRDLSLLVTDSLPFASIAQVIRTSIPAALLKRLQLFDQYRGEALPAGKKSIAIALTLQDEHRTLVDNEVNIIISATLKALNEKLDVILRD